MKILLCIDDTDNLESIGTGELLENLCKELATRNLAIFGFVSRHQLFIHDEIAYTSHNSSMCCELKIEEFHLDEIISFAKEYLEKNSAIGSDPGLCVICIEDLEEIKNLVDFSNKAKTEVLNKSDAYKLAQEHNKYIFLSEHGGTGDGVIGALAGCGLRLSGMDGRVKGKIIPENPLDEMKIEEFCHKYNISKAIDGDFQEVNLTDLMISGTEIKPIVWKNQPTIVLTPVSEGSVKWRAMSKKELNKNGIGR